jgi:uncharacterized protein (TIGR00255 family)
MMGELASMTGLAEVQGFLSPSFSARVRVWSVNAKGLEVNLRLFPRGDYPELELALRKIVAEEIARGRVTVVVELAPPAEKLAPQLRWEVAEALATQWAEKSCTLPLAPLRLADLLALPGFSQFPFGPLAEEEQAALCQLVRSCLHQLRQARQREASWLLPALQQDLQQVASFVGFLQEQGAQLRAQLLQRLQQGLKELLMEGVSEERLLQEAALAALRADVAEEKNRLAAHVQHFQRLLQQGGPVGRKLDFLVQEMLREVNTAGSKLREAGVGEQVVETKAALERLREQIANLE